MTHVNHQSISIMHNDWHTEIDVMLAYKTQHAEEDK